MSGPGPGSGSDDPSTDRSADTDETNLEDDTPTEPSVPPAQTHGEPETDRPRGEELSGDNSKSEPKEMIGDDTEWEPPETGRPAATIEDDGIVRWFFKTEDGRVVAIRDVLTSVAIVAVIGLVLFGVSGIWPPLVAVESGSMEPNMERGDLIFVANEERFVGDNPAAGTGVVTYEDAVASGHEKFNQPGDVIIFRPDGELATDRTQIIHRAHYWVEEDENWVETKAQSENLNGATCSQLQHCPAPHDGFITKGDNNPGYDQANGGAPTTVVREEWVTAKGVFRVPYLGYVRLTFDQVLTTTPAAAVPLPPTPSPAGSTEALIGITGAVAVGSRHRFAQ